MSLTVERTRASVITLSNSVDLAAKVISNIAGKEIASSINNNNLTSNAVRTLIAHRLQKNILSNSFNQR